MPSRMPAEPRVERIGDLLERPQRIARLGDQSLGFARAEQRIDLGEDAVHAHRRMVQPVGKLPRIDDDVVDIVRRAPRLSA